jgi:competence ComEA-like helix-hairpin-helix protein
MLALPACVKRSRDTGLSPKSNAQPAASSPAITLEPNDQQPTPLPRTIQRININTAAANELETLPGIGKGLAERIIEHRERFGSFRRIEHLIIVRGISDRRFRGLQDLITVE